MKLVCISQNNTIKHDTWTGVLKLQPEINMCTQLHTSNKRLACKRLFSKASSTNPRVNTAPAVHTLQLTSLKRSYDQHYLKRFGLKLLATDHNLSTRDYINTSHHNKYIQIPYTVLMRWYHAFMNDAYECSMKFTIFDPGPINPEPLLIRFWLWCELTIAQIRLIQTFALRS